MNYFDFFFLIENYFLQSSEARVSLLAVMLKKIFDLKKKRLQTSLLVITKQNMPLSQI